TAACSGQGVGETVVGQHQPQRVAHPFGGGLVATTQDHDQFGNGFFVAVSGGVGQQAGDHIGSGGGSPFDDQFPHDFHEGALGPHGALPAVYHVGHESGHVITPPIVPTVEPTEDESRQASGVGGTKVGAGGAAEGVDETVRHPGAHHTQFVEVDRRQDRADGRGTSPVFLPFRVEERGYFHDHGKSGPVLGDLVPGVPPVGLAGEHARGTEYVM